MSCPAARRLLSVERALGPAGAAAAEIGAGNEKLLDNKLVSAADMAAFVRDGFLVLPNLVEAGDISLETCGEIFAEGYAQRDLPGMGESRTALFERISDNMNKVMASPTL